MNQGQYSKVKRQLRVLPFSFLLVLTIQRSYLEWNIILIDI